MEYKNISIETENGEFFFAEAQVAIDATGFLVLEEKDKRTFIDLGTIRVWSYEYEEQPDKNESSGKLYTIDGGHKLN